VSGDVTTLVAANTVKAGDNVVLPNGRYVEVTRITNATYEAVDATPHTTLVRIYYQATDGEVGVMRFTPDSLVEKEMMT
jgi:hypothetical protein